MNAYSFFTAQLRFVAAKTHRENDDIDQMMNVLHSIADQIDEGETFQLEANRIRLGARALAGVAGFLQQHILPEVISQKNMNGEKQIRWTIDTSMSLMAKMMTHAEMTHDKEPLKLTLDAPPDLSV
ncbi:hypothetical protein [Magnetovibrio blakemorei]|uniref:Uncharacterized protein n=1 Tax=Magnetovibrio blakemorei TaxID=28181 RepID=A0A1E5Q5G2_9PROT|nr:hypothetical protein [Magnetovibrio blakemorei]OEJ65685.1 hypothetical protein BEN30_13620 [Magnetovibrio blakemorei]